ncbi:MAG TPA: hypothetical protein VFE51_23945 [Verrucomicrobiae bacterium]|nr:hypothetical protein [Verrucomicrobiae bacterium]
MEKKLRFGDLVRNSGRPQAVTLWTTPDNNPGLKKAVKQNRVLTVVMEPRKRDYGRIGLQLHPGASYLVFPKSLPDEPGARVIGVNYQLLDQPGPSASHPSKVAGKSKPKKNFKPVIWNPPTQRFKVKVRRTATVEDEVTVQAADQETAERQALKQASHKPFKRSNVQAEVVKIER